MKRISLLALLFFTLTTTFSQSKIADKTKNWKAYDGYFKFWWDAANGKIWLQIDKFDQELLYVNTLPAGLGSNDIGLDRGQIGASRIVYFNKVGKKVLMTQPNYDYRAVTDDKNEQRAVKNSFAQSILWSFVVDEDEGDKVLVDATPFFLRDAHGAADRIKNMKQGSYTFNEGRSAIYLPNTKNFPLNSEFEATITFTGGSDAGRFVQAVTPSPEAISLRMHHSFVQLPDNQYKPRRYDIRSGYNGISFFDYSSPISEPIEKIYIARHRLKKRDPNAAISDPIKPIVYYLDNGTPEPIRSALLEGGRWWNQAYEAAGYRNAFRVEVLPDTADPMDIRYNVINWVHRSTRGWSYGASVTDPRTGEIIKGQVTLGSLRVRQDYLIFTGLLAPYETGKQAPETMKLAALQRLRQLSAHEIGHTLGLMHNYASSVNDRASVMDYPHPSIPPPLGDGGLDFSKVYTNEIGEWDKRAIIYGYQDFGEMVDETPALNKILEENTAKGLLNISDFDARAADGMHPQAHLWDNGKEPVSELQNMLKVRQKALTNFSEKNIQENVPMSRLEDVLVPVYNYHRYQLEAVCKLIGGMNYSYSVRGDKQQQPEILSNAVQTKALDAAIACLDPSVLTLPESILKLIPPRPPEYYGIGELMPKRSGAVLDPLAAAEALANYELAFLFNPQRANRLMMFKGRANTIGFDDVLGKIIEKTWSEPLKQGIEGQIQVQTQQMVLTYLLSLKQNDNANYIVKSICTDYLERFGTFFPKFKLKNTFNSITPSQKLALERIRKEDNKEVPLPQHREMPPGAPIGCAD